MKVIFLDVDGVLNCETSKSKCDGDRGCDTDKLKRLKKIVDATGAIIILNSPEWKSNPKKMKYLKNKLSKFKMKILGTTPFGSDRSDEDRINQWFKNNDDINITSWISISSKFGFLDNTIKTDFEFGLTDDSNGRAITLLNEGGDN